MFVWHGQSFLGTDSGCNRSAQTHSRLRAHKEEGHWHNTYSSSSWTPVAAPHHFDVGWQILLGTVEQYWGTAWKFGFGAGRAPASSQKRPLAPVCSSRHLQDGLCWFAFPGRCLALESHKQQMFSHTDCMEEVKQTEAALPAQATQNQDCVGTALPRLGGSRALHLLRAKDRTCALPCLYRFILTSKSHFCKVSG